jgi:hypothetical protein
MYIYWSAREKKVLAKLYPMFVRGEINKDDLLRVFPKRNFVGIKTFAMKMGFNKREGEINEEFYRQLLKVRKI